MAEISPLRRRMIEDMTVRNLSPATQQSYLNAVSKFSRYFGRSPDRLPRQRDPGERQERVQRIAARCCGSSSEDGRRAGARHFHSAATSDRGDAAVVASRRC
jgi:Phage integrase, N-terminal SAM-like domain